MKYIIRFRCTLQQSGAGQIKISVDICSIEMTNEQN
jgi:hypothetical protein